MTQPDHQDRAPGMGDPTRSDDTAVPGLRTGGAGSGAEDQVSGPAPEEGDTGIVPGEGDPGTSGHQGGQLGAAGGGYGAESGSGTSGGSPDGEDVQVTSGPGPQTDWLRGAQGMGEPERDDLGR